MPVVRRSDRTRNLRAPNVTRWQGGAATAPGPAFDPLSLTWTRYYDYSDASSVTLNVSAISQINDQSGNAGHAVQATGTAQPAYTTAAQNGLNVGTFDGTTDFLATPANITLSLSTMVFIVAKISTVAAAQQFLVSNGSPPGNRMVIYKLATSHLWSIYNGAAVISSAVAADTNWHVFCVRFDSGGSSYLMLDGVQILSGNPGTGGLSSNIFQMGQTTFNGQMGFAGLCPALSDIDRDAMIGHLQSKWGIAGA